MKLLQLNVTANWGSTGKIAEGIGLAATLREWESAIAYGREMNPSQSLLIKVGNQFDVYSHYAQHRLFDREGLGSKGATKRLINWIDSYQPDIIHLHNIHDHWLNYPLLFQYFATIDTPIVWTFHDCWAFTGGCAHFESVECFKWRDGGCLGKCEFNHRLAATQLEQRKELIGKIGKRLTIVCVSQWLADYVNQSFILNTGANVVVLHNGIDVNNIFLPKLAPKERMILGVSNIWSSYKGLNDFIGLRTMLPKDIGITLVGLTQKQIDSFPIGISGLKRIDSAEGLAALYNRASVFVNPTYNDSFPTVNLEALACGTPVVTYCTGGSPEAIDSRTGIVVGKGDKTGLTKAIMKVIDNPNLFSSEDCRVRAEQIFNKDIQFNKYIDLYNRLLGVDSQLITPPIPRATI